jgi:hypothetical protein
MLMRLKNITFLILLFIFVNSCQQALIKKENSTVNADSSLFFKQVAIEDPFLDKLAANSNQSFTLKKTLIPPSVPEPELPRFNMIDGYRVQIFAGVDSLNALTNKSIARNAVTDSIYLFSDKGLFKLQVGNYPYYPQADSIKRIFRQTHFPGAWVVQTKIQIAIKDSSTDSSDFNSSGKFKIQVLTTADESKAKEIVNEVKKQFNYNAFYEGTGNIFKVFVGYFNDEAAARKMLKSIREGNYPDAWMVY